MRHAHPLRRGDGLAPTDPALLATPLEFISADHMRERQICAVIDSMVLTPPFDRKAARTVLRFLNEEWSDHLRDEAEDLFPLLARRCQPEDGIGAAIARIKCDQDEAAHLLPEMRVTLARCLDAACDLSAQDRDLLTRFAGHVRRHLLAETAILLPIARARLTWRDLTALSHRMRARRGLPPLPEARDAE